MSGGKIIGNTAGELGGGVSVIKDGTFTMTGGEITGNTPPSGAGVKELMRGRFTHEGGKVEDYRFSFKGGDPW